MLIMEKLQQIIIYVQVVDLFVKLCVFIALLVGIIYMIKYIAQRTRQEKALFEKEMHEKSVKNAMDVDTVPKFDIAENTEEKEQL